MHFKLSRGQLGRNKGIQRQASNFVLRDFVLRWEGNRGKLTIYLFSLVIPFPPFISTSGMRVKSYWTPFFSGTLVSISISVGSYLKTVPFYFNTGLGEVAGQLPYRVKPFNFLTGRWDHQIVNGCHGHSLSNVGSNMLCTRTLEHPKSEMLSSPSLHLSLFYSQSHQVSTCSISRSALRSDAYLWLQCLSLFFTLSGC